MTRWPAATLAPICSKMFTWPMAFSSAIGTVSEVGQAIDLAPARIAFFRHLFQARNDGHQQLQDQRCRDVGIHTHRQHGEIGHSAARKQAEQSHKIAEPAGIALLHRLAE